MTEPVKGSAVVRELEEGCRAVKLPVSRVAWGPMSYDLRTHVQHKEKTVLQIVGFGQLDPVGSKAPHQGVGIARACARAHAYACVCIKDKYSEDRQKQI